MSDNSNQYVQSEELHGAKALQTDLDKLRRTLQHREDLVLERVALEQTITTLRESLKKAESVMNAAKAETRKLEQLERRYAEELEARTMFVARLSEARHILYEVLKSRGL